MSELFTFRIGVFATAIAMTMFSGKDMHRKNSCVAYIAESGKYELGWLAQDFYESDAFVVVVNDHRKLHAPLVVDARKVRFFTDDGLRINEANWKTL